MRSLRARASGRAAVVALAAALALATGTVPAGAVPAGGQGPGHATVTNAGFEQGLRGWRVTGDVAAAKVEADGRTGSRLTNWSADDYAVRSTQTVAGLRPGWWTVSAWVKSGGAFDASGLTKNEDLGATYADAAGRPGDAVEILADAGMNLGRLRVWVDPADGYNDLDNVVAMGQRIKAAGMQLLVDFHYSDRWADPGAQHMPAAWQGLTPAELADAVYAHTREVLDALAAVGVTADGGE